MGGQAINIWARLYLPRVEALRVEGPFTSKDIDFLGDQEAVRECARRLPLGQAFIEPPFERETCISSGIVKFVDDDGKERAIDFLWNVMGLKAEEVRVTAPTVVIQEQPIVIMHPVLCVLGRGSLICDLGRVDAHTLSQARASVICAKEFLRDMLSDGGIRAVLKWNERIFSYSQTMPGLALYGEHQIDVFKAVLTDDRLPKNFLETRYPQMREQLSRKRAKHLALRKPKS